MISCMIVDDEQAAIDVLSRHIEATPFLQLVHTETNAVNALAYLEKNPVQLVFLDVNMPPVSGLDFLRIAGSKAHFIMCTGYSDYAVQGFEFGVVDYLVKPVDYERFLTAALRALARIEPGSKDGVQESNCIFIRTGLKNQHLRVDFNDILYIECDKNYATFFLSAGKETMRCTMKYLEQILPFSYFIRINKSFIVPINDIKKVDNNVLYLKRHNKELPIGDRFKPLLYQVLGIKGE
jgi:two-component system, LytTR family, response regulator